MGELAIGLYHDVKERINMHALTGNSALTHARVNPLKDCRFGILFMA